MGFRALHGAAGEVGYRLPASRRCLRAAPRSGSSGWLRLAANRPRLVKGRVYFDTARNELTKGASSMPPFLFAIRRARPDVNEQLRLVPAR